jgi:hypothetical protein
MCKRKVEPTKPEDYIEVNIGTNDSPKIVKIGKNVYVKERQDIEGLIKEYKDVFSWSYDDLKSYKENIIQHTIPLIEGAKPF